jgi:hypothetical protein
MSQFCESLMTFERMFVEDELLPKAYTTRDFT